MKTISKACATLAVMLLLTVCLGSGSYANAGSGYSSQTVAGSLPTTSMVAAQPDAAGEQNRIARIKACANRVLEQATSQCISEVVGGHHPASIVGCNNQVAKQAALQCFADLQYWDSHPGELDAVLATEAVNADNDGLAHYGESDNGRTIRVQQGTHFDVRLPAYPYGDLDWSWDTNGSGSAGIGTVDTVPNSEKGRKDYTLEALGHGKVTLVFQLTHQSQPEWRASSDPRCQWYHYARHHTCVWQLPPPPPVKTIRITFDITN